jgi:hypothetical protein
MYNYTIYTTYNIIMRKGCIIAYVLVPIIANACSTYTHVKNNFIHILACN